MLPVMHPNISVSFVFRDRRRDRDNMLTTILDYLRDAGVITNDNIAQLNCTITVFPATVDEYEHTVVEVACSNLEIEVLYSLRCESAGSMFDLGDIVQYLAKRDTVTFLPDPRVRIE